MKVTFFYPAKNVGGAQILFARVAQYLATKHIQVVILDYGESYISNYLLENETPFLHLIVNKDNSLISETLSDSILLLSLSFINLIDKALDIPDECRIMFWDLHPYNVIENTFFSYFYKNDQFNSITTTLKIIEKSRLLKLKCYLNLAHKKNGLVFMCRRNFLTNHSFFNLDFQPKYIPVSIDNQEVLNTDFHENITVNRQSNTIRVGWLSRLEKDKVNILNLLIKDLAIYAQKKNIKIILHIIGEGSYYKFIKKTNNITICLKGKLLGSELTPYIHQNLDIGFAMGMSALEFATRSIPTVLVPSSTLYDYYASLDKKYIWLHNSTDFDIATEAHHFKKTLSIAEIFHKFSASELNKLGALSHQYVIENHSIDFVGDLVIDSLKLNTLYFRDIKALGIYNYTLFEKILSNTKVLGKKIKLLYFGNK